jgi:SAM-dependent methyltransferase
LLDFGCGRGGLVAAALEQGFDAVGVDVAAWNLWTEGVAAPGRIALIPPDDRLPFADATFDAVTSNVVFEHLLHPEPALAELARVLKPGGLLLTLFPAREMWFEPHLKAPWLHRLPRGSRAERWSLALGNRVTGIRGEDPTEQLWRLHETTLYRTEAEWRALFARHFTPEGRHEAEWLRDLLARRGVALPLPRALLAWLCPRLAGLCWSWRRPA